MREGTAWAPLALIGMTVSFGAQAQQDPYGGSMYGSASWQPAEDVDRTLPSTPGGSGDGADRDVRERRAIQGPELAPSAQRVATDDLDLVNSYMLARLHDPTFRAAQAERRVNRTTAEQTITAALPAANYNLQNIPTESGSRHVFTVTQPILSLSALATLRQRGPRRAFADATFGVREQDLAVRLLTAVVEIIRANEAVRLNVSRVEALELQSLRANRLYQAGQGTITDAREIAVRYEQALANQILLENDAAAAVVRFRSLTTVTPTKDDFNLPEEPGPIALEDLTRYIEQQNIANPQVLAARQSERIGRLEAARIRGGLFPTVGASGTVTRRDGATDAYVGISVSAPLNAGTLFQTDAARATADRAFEERRQVEERARTELERLHALVSGARRALEISKRSIEAAELSVEANTRSYEGGVRSSVDVVNAIQTLFEVRNAYVVAATNLATNYLNVLLLAGIPPADSLLETQTFLLRDMQPGG